MWACEFWSTLSILDLQRLKVPQHGRTKILLERLAEQLGLATQQPKQSERLKNV